MVTFNKIYKGGKYWKSKYFINQKMKNHLTHFFVFWRSKWNPDFCKTLLYVPKLLLLQCIQTEKAICYIT